MDNVLTNKIFPSIKELLGPSANDTAFDNEILLDLNSAIMILTQIGVGTQGFTVVTGEETWEDLGIDPSEFALVKTYLSDKTKLMFDPPVSTVLLNSLNQRIAEAEWRLRTRAEVELRDGE